MQILIIVLIAVLFGTTGAARAAVLSDGALIVDIDNDGEFNVVSLNGLEIDTSSFVQKYVGAVCDGFTGGSAVNVSGTTATYTASCGDFSVAVTSRILGALPSASLTSDVLEQTLVLTNESAAPSYLELLSNMDQDLVNSGDDVVAFVPALDAVVSTDITQSPDRLMAAIARSSDPAATFGWDVDFLSSESVLFPTANKLGPIGPGDTAMSIGFQVGNVAPGASVTLGFRYLFLLGAASLPSDFDFGPNGPTSNVPVLSEAGLLAIAALLVGIGAVSLRRRGRA